MKINQVSLPKFIFVGILLSILLFSGCKTNNNGALTPYGSLLRFDGCKFQENSTFSANPVDQRSDCLQYRYDGQNTLTIKHLNAAFNCCPGEIQADIEFIGDKIIITEYEKEYGCKCICLYDVEYEIKDLVPGTYTLKIIEPYVQSNDRVMQFTIKVRSSMSGIFCMDRDYYPWLP